VVFEGLVVGAVLLLEEGLGVGSGNRAGDAGEDRQGNQGGYDGLHGLSPNHPKFGLFIRGLALLAGECSSLVTLIWRCSRMRKEVLAHA